MNKKAAEREKLLAETFHGEWTDGRGAEFARNAASLVRRRRAGRRALLACGIAAIGAAAFIPFRRLPPSPPEVSALGKPSPAYEIISDDELLTLLHDRPLLVMPKKNGVREFVLVDQ